MIWPTTTMAVALLLTLPRFSPSRPFDNSPATHSNRGERRPHRRFVMTLGALSRPVPNRGAAHLDADRWADALSEIARSVRAGESLHASMIALAPWPDQPALQQAVARLDSGVNLAGALERDHDQQISADAQIALATLRVCARHGGRVAHALDATAATLRIRAAAVQERVVFASQAKMSSKVLSLLPIAVALWTLATDANARAVWFGGPLGAVLLASGLALNIGGWLWMRAIAAEP